MKSLIEQETYIHFNQEETEENWIIYTSHKPTATKLKKMGYSVKREIGPGIEFKLPARCVKLKDLKEGGFDLI